MSRRTTAAPIYQVVPEAARVGLGISARPVRILAPAQADDENGVRQPGQRVVAQVHVAAAEREKRHVAAQFRRHGGKFGQGQAKFPAQVRGHQGRGCIAGTTAQTSGGGNPLDQPQPRTLFRSRPPANQVHRSQDEIPAIARHFFKTAAVTRKRVARPPNPTGTPIPSLRSMFLESTGYRTNRSGT